jgi:hypothetical protein
VQRLKSKLVVAVLVLAAGYPREAPWETISSVNWARLCGGVRRAGGAVLFWIIDPHERNWLSWS